MVDMPAYHPDDIIDAPGDDAFADELSGNLYHGGRSGRTSYTASRAAPPRGLYGIAQKQLFGMAEGGKAELLRNIGGLVTMIREITLQIDGYGVEPFAGYARQASDVVNDIHDSLAEKSIEALIDDGRALVRDRPEIAIVAAVLVGFIGARLVRARA